MTLTKFLCVQLLLTNSNKGKSEKREPEDWGGASGRPPHTSVSLHLVSDGRPPAPPAPANRQLMRRRTQDTLVAVAPAQSALSGDGDKWHTSVLHGLLAPTVD